jgi:pilus assembly protein FimV
MSKEVLEQVVLKASSDARFRAQMNDNFEAALKPYDLSPAEKSKLRSGIAGLSDDREVRRMMAASTASSVAASSTAASANAGSTDAGSTDAGSTDAGSTDAGSANAGSVDVGSVDAGSVDAGSVDVGTVDAGSHLTS